jgi:2-oxoacid:acceptor oxidoreductase delta subunit (pyruvate/2-ketoisovalerate family)
MPAHPEEIQAAREEGVVFHFLVSPEEIETTPDGKVQAVVLARMDLGEPDESGRRRPVKRPGDVFAIEADTVITAIGERPGLGAFQSVIPTTGSAALVDGWLQAATPNDGRAPVFAGGDMIEGPRTVVHAVAAGKKAALVMDMIHKGLDVAQTLDDIRIGDGPALSFAAYKGLAPLGPGPLNRHKVVTADQMVLDYFSQIPRVVSPETKPEDRIRSFDPTIRGLSEAEAARAAERCLHCGRCTMCHNCLIFCPDVSILLQEKPESGYEIDYDYCKGCGICQAECPRRAITLEEEESGGEGTF